MASVPCLPACVRDVPRNSSVCARACAPSAASDFMHVPAYGLLLGFGIIVGQVQEVMSRVLV